MSPDYAMGFKKESDLQRSVRNKRIIFETIIESFDLQDGRLDWTVSNLMWLNQNIPSICRGRPRLDEVRELIVHLLRNHCEFNIP